MADGRLSESMVDWCIDEVRYRASKVSDPTNPPPVFVFHGDVYRSDNAVSPGLKRELEAAVQDFESKIPETKKDWHPGSNEQVWDLVHPSLFPLVYGRTRILPDGQKTTLEDCISRSGEGVTIPVPLNKEIRESRSMRHNPFSKKYQWLPCEVDISGTRSRYFMRSTSSSSGFINTVQSTESRVISTISIPSERNDCTASSRN